MATTTTTTTYYYSSAPITHIELDLSTCQRPNSIADRINDVVPGLKTGTAFFHFLRANLALQPSGMSSNVSTPVLEPQGAFARPSSLGRTISSASAGSASSSSVSKRPISPQRRRQQQQQQQQLSSSSSSARVATAATAAPTNLDDIPPLSLDILTSRNDKVDALKLIADSIAQQRQRAASSLIVHPILLAGLALALGITYQFAWARRPSHDRDAGLAMTLTAGVGMAYLFAIRYATVGYIHLAEALNYDFLLPNAAAAAAAQAETSSISDEDIVIGTRYGTEIIGACVLRLEPTSSDSSSSSSSSSPSSSSRRKHHSRHNSLRGGKGVIRAWTVRMRYRGKGVGADMLHEAVRITRERCGRDAAVGFAAEHANSGEVLPEMFNRPFRQAERRAAGALEKVLGEWEGMKRKR